MKCMEISLENLYLDIGDIEIKATKFFLGHTVCTVHVYTRNRNTVTWLNGWDAGLPHFHFFATVIFSMEIMMRNISLFLTLLFSILLTKDICKANSNHTFLHSTLPLAHC